MKCMRCGAEIGEESAFCPSCGMTTQQGVVFSNTNPETGNTTAVSFGPNGIHTHILSPIKNPKVALAATIVVVVLAVVGFGVGVWAMIRQGENDTVNQPAVVAEKDEGGKADTKDTGEMIVDCNRADGKNSMDIKYTAKDGAPTTLVYKFVFDADDPNADEDFLSQMAFTMLAMGLLAAEDSGVEMLETENDGLQQVTFDFDMAKISKDTRQAIFDGKEVVTSEEMYEEIEAAAREAGLSCSITNH